MRKPRQGDPKKVVGYLRVSTEEQHLGPEAQLAALEAWCTREGRELVATFLDKGVSGGTEAADRDGLKQALEALDEHLAGVLLVAKRDRLARGVVIAATIEQLVRKAGAQVVSADGVGVGDGPEAELMRFLIDGFAQYERAVIRSRTRAALGRKRVKGERIGEVPYGSKVSIDGRRLELDAPEVRALERLRELRAQGLSLRQLVAQLNAEGVPARGKRWHLTTVQRLLSREPEPQGATA